LNFQYLRNKSDQYEIWQDTQDRQGTIVGGPISRLDQIQDGGLRTS